MNMPQPKPTLLMLGGNRSTIGAIRAIKAAGFTLILAEKLPRQYAMVEADVGWEIAPHDVSALEKAIKQYGGVDGIIGINETAMLAAAVLQERLGLPGLSVDVIAKTGSKLAQRQSWAGNSLTRVPYRVVYAIDEIHAVTEELGGYPLVFKPDRSHGGSRGVSVVQCAEDALDAFLFAQNHALDNSGIVIEQALSGPQFSAELLVANGKTSVIAIGRKVKSQAPYCVDLAICYPGLVDQDEISAVEAMCSEATRALGITQGPGHIEFAITENGPRPIELGARSGGSLTADLAAHVGGVHPMVEAARLACGLKTQTGRVNLRQGAVLMFLAFPPGRVKSLHIPANLSQNKNILDVDGYLPDDHVIQPIQWTSQRSGYLGVIARNGSEAIEVARQVSKEIFVIGDDDLVKPMITF